MEQFFIIRLGRARAGTIVDFHPIRLIALGVFARRRLKLATRS